MRGKHFAGILRVSRFSVFPSCGVSSNYRLVIVIPMLAGIQSLLPIGLSGENNVFGHGEVVMFQKRVAEMRLHVLQPVLFHNGNQPRIVSVTIADVVLPTLVYAVPSGGASHIQFPVIGIGNYIHALLTGQRAGGSAAGRCPTGTL